MDNDVDMLVPGPEVDEDVPEFKESAEEISRTFFKIGIVQLVLGIIVIAGGILATVFSDPWWGTDCTGGGIWGGVLVLVSGSLVITSRYHLLFGVVVASLVANLVAAVALLAAIVLSMISTFAHFSCIGCGYPDYGYIAFAALNCGLILCLLLTIYMSIVYAKILNGSRNLSKHCCVRSAYQDQNPYTMVYVPPGGQQANVPRQAGAFVAAPYAQPV